MKKKYYRYIIIIFLLIILFIYLINANYFIYSFLSYTKNFYTKLFPSAFIFYLISNLLIDYKFVELISKILHINGSIFYILLMSIISGFPSGSKYIKDLLNKNIITSNYANYLIIFTHFPNPLFITTTVNLIINNNKICYLILISLITANLLIGIILKPKEKELIKQNKIELESFSYYLSNSIYNSFKIILLIYGTSIFFYLISIFIIKYLNFTIITNIIISGLFDITNGIISCSILKTDILKYLFIITFISFGGISIHFQVLSIINNTKIKYKNFLLGRIFQILIANSLFIILYTLINN